MKFFTRSSNDVVKKKILKIDPLKRMWLFGIIILLFSILAEPKIIPAILAFMIFLTYAQHRAKKRALTENKKIIEEELEDLEKKMFIVNEHIDSGQATLEEKLLIQELDEILEITSQEYEQCLEQIDKVNQLEEKFKNFLVKLKKASKMITTGKKEKK